MTDHLDYDLDDTGKIILDDVYDNPDPRPYFNALGKLDYVIPGVARPVFSRVIDAMRHVRERFDIKALDVGCSYGINAATLKYGLSMDELYARYGSQAVDDLARDELVASDREFYAGHVGDPALKVAGLDVAAQAVEYALDAEILDGGIVANLETVDLKPKAAARVATADIILSTGCIGYARERTVEQLAAASEDNRPWMAHFVLRMFPFENFADLLASYGYVTESVDRTFLQRRFASDEERGQVLDNLAALGRDPTGMEADGWYHAEFFLSRPAREAEALPIGRILAS
ncbi:MAG: class I SAM-dependent methyltransferase [Alphaproteobacteria bacterium]